MIASRLGDDEMQYAVTVTPSEPDGYELPSTTYVFSEEDLEDPELVELLGPLILDWGEFARWIDELGRRLDNMSEAELEQLGLGRR